MDQLQTSSTSWPPELRAGEGETLTALHTALEDRAIGTQSLDLAYRTLDTPVGNLLLAATPRGLARVAYEGEDHDRVLEALALRVGPRILRAPRRLDAVAVELDEYFRGQRTSFDVALDRVLSRGFRLGVLEQLSGIRYGQTQSYAQVARAAGSAGAVRAVGSACATNPLPVVVPCHRVLRSDGSLGGYIGGLAAKRLLLELEARVWPEASC